MMNSNKFCAIMNKHILQDRKKEILRIIAEKEFYIGRFSLLKGEDILNQCLQHLLQSHEIRMGDALEEIIEEILKMLGFKSLSKIIVNKNGETLSLDQYFTDDKKFYFIEQKIRDDHDSTKKRGQISNFEKKLEILFNKHSSALVGIMYFIDPELYKNKNYYLQELKKLEEFYGVKLYLFYGRELFEYLTCPKPWDKILLWLKQWKESLPELPEINFDKNPEESFKEIKDLDLRNWRKILENDKLWDEGIIKAIFRKGLTLKMLLRFFKSQQKTPYIQLANFLNEKIEKYY